MNSIDWDQKNILFIANELHEISDIPDEKIIRKIIEPWLTAVFQSEHLSLLLGTGITTGICSDAEIMPQAMGRIEFTTNKDKIKQFAETEAKSLGRGSANFEDDLRTALELLKGLKILAKSEAKTLETEINEKLKCLVKNLIGNESRLLLASKGADALALLKRFLISFASRTATRDRLHIFTTNYDRLIEYALDAAGIYALDRFVGKLNPTMRMHKMELDYHYNPPGIRGEPRYVEGVVRYTKLHGSLDWRFKETEIQRAPLPFGTKPRDEEMLNYADTVVIYPNASKGIDTAYYPYSELFRDFATAVCRPNSVLVTYGYGFGDSHINTTIADMMSIPSTHLVIISYDLADGRIEKFVEKCNRSQLTLLVGNHLGSPRPLTENYLPKSAIDRISNRKHEILEKRGRGDHNQSTADIANNSS